MDLTTLLAAMIPLGIFIYWVIEFAKDVTNKNWNGVLTRSLAVGAAFLILTVYANSSITLGGDAVNALKNLGWADILFLSLAFAATSGTGADVLRTFNRSDPKVALTLIPPAQNKAA